MEFLAPYTIDTGDPVFLVGYIFAADTCPLPWQAACQRLQVGGERGYGWGDLALIRRQPTSRSLFSGGIHFDGSGERPTLQIEPGQCLLAHTVANGITADGELEPLVGREWRLYPGRQVAYTSICYVPGSRLERTSAASAYVVVGRFGIWKQCVTDTDN